MYSQNSMSGGTGERTGYMDLSDYIKAIRDRWFVVVVCLILGVGAAFVVTQRMPAVYTADAMLFVKVDSTSGSLYEDRKSVV